MSSKIHEEGSDSESRGDLSFSAPPPSYTEATLRIPAGPRSRRPPYNNEKAAADPIDELVSRLPSLVRERQQSRASQRFREDDALIQHMMPMIRDFLLDFSTDDNARRWRNSHEPLSMELMLVPQDAAPGDEGWQMAGLDERKGQSAFFRLNYISAPEKKLLRVPKDGGSVRAGGDAAESAEPDTLWWRDEDHALRLASALQSVMTPERSERSDMQHLRQAGVGEQPVIPEQSESKRKSPMRSLFGLSKKPQPPVERAAPEVQDDKTFATVSLGSVQVHVQAEEVTFRRENDFGLWESSSGWAIAVRATVLY
jgi:hypothetical protein